MSRLDVTLRSCHMRVGGPSPGQAFGLVQAVTLTQRQSIVGSPDHLSIQKVVLTCGNAYVRPEKSPTVEFFNKIASETASNGEAFCGPLCPRAHESREG